MSRAFGDLPCRRIGVTVEPELTVHRLRADDELLVAATDGIWDVLSNEDVLALAGNATGAQAAARTLVEVAESRWLDVEGGYVDDITAVVVRAQPAGGAASSA
jgi:serine/threonine protein phosphatase PrpC